MNITKEAVQVLTDEKGNLIGLIYNNIENRDKVWYKCEKMGEDDFEAIINKTNENLAQTINS